MVLEDTNAPEYPFTWHPISDEERAERAEIWTGPKSCIVDVMRSEPMGIIMPKLFVERKMYLTIWNMKPRPDDIWMVTYPKCGSTMGQELLWQMSHGVNVDSEESKSSIFLRVPFLEMSCLSKGDSHAVPAITASTPELKEKMAEVGKMVADTVAHAESLPGPRVIKTHLPLSMLPPDLLKISKVVVMARNVKDACISFFHHEKLLPAQALRKDCPLETYAKLYMDGKVLYGPYWAHLKDVWRKREDKNLKIVWYEDARKDLQKTINEIGDFIGHKVPDEKMTALLEHMKIDNFKKNDAVNMKPMKGMVPDEVRDKFNFIRKGNVGEWKECFSPEKIAEWNQWIADNNKDDAGQTIGISYE